MISYTTGNILEAQTSALVNTVNCEGFMGKGIAYQFKLRFPQNNAEYVKYCRNNQLKIGTLLIFKEDDKIIINFPTKDKWRKDSEYTFIEKGLITLKDKIITNNIKSIAIPPLGCGNGGLEWSIVKNLIINTLKDIQIDVDIIIYEPINKSSIQFKTSIKEVSKLSTSHLLLMSIKLNLNKFTRLRLQKTAYINNIISGQNYFKFTGQDYGPYAHSIEILSRDIKEYQKFYNLDTLEAYKKAKLVLTSKNVDATLNTFDTYLTRTLNIVNNISKDSELELLTSILFIINEGIATKTEDIINSITNWNEHKKNCFDSKTIINNINHLLSIGLIEKELYGDYRIQQNIK